MFGFEKRHACDEIMSISRHPVSITIYNYLSNQKLVYKINIFPLPENCDYSSTDIGTPNNGIQINDVNEINFICDLNELITYAEQNNN